MVEDFERALNELEKNLQKEFKKIKIERDYSTFGLKFNPFPSAGLPRYSRLGPLDDENSVVIRRFIMSTYSKKEDETFGDFGGLTIIGDYGMGKTHLMRYIEFLINRLNGSKRTNFSALTSFIDRPEDSPQKVIHRIIEQIGSDTLRKFIWLFMIDKFEKEGLEKFVSEYSSRQKTITDTNEKWSALFAEPCKSNPREFLEKFRSLNGNFTKLQEECRSVVKSSIAADDILASRYLDLILPEKDAEVTWDVLAGYIGNRDIQKREIHFLKSIVRILRKSGYNLLYVFIDEFEDVSKLKGTKLTNYLLTLNTLINSEKNWAVVVSLTREALKTIKKESPPLYERLTVESIQLEPLNTQKAAKLLTSYLNLARAKQENTFPFSANLIEQMVILSKGNYRSFIRKANKIIETALLERISPPFEIDILEKVRGSEN